VEATVETAPRVRPTRATGLAAALLAVLGGSLAEAGSAGQPESAASPLRVERLIVTPERPGSDTLCRLVVRLHNGGEKPMYAFAFDVELNGVPLPVYERQLFLQSIPAGKSAEVRLFNFWTTETGRARPADGRLAVEVKVREALWLDVTTEPAAADGERKADEPAEPVEVWSPAGEVPGLPVRGSLTLELSS
jgi:hypothetical protein